jgi:hypothetical protein
MSILKQFQKHILYTHSATYKYNLIQKSVNYFDNKVQNGDFRFFNIGSELESIYDSWNPSFDFLENELVKKSETDSNNIYGYNSKIIDSLLYNPPDNLIFHTDMFNFVDNIYRVYFSNLSDFEMYNVIYSFDINPIHNSSNYLKTCFDTDINDYSFLPRTFFFHLNPLRLLAQPLLNQITTSIKKEIYNDVKVFDIKTNLKVTDSNYFNDKISDFVINTIFNGTQFNDYYKQEISSSINMSEVEDLFNQFIDKFIPSNDFLKYSSSVFSEYVYDYVYDLYINESGITCDIPNKFPLIINDIIQKQLSKFKSNSEFRSIVSITYKYRNDKLQFINSTLMVFSMWLDLILENQKNDLNFKHYLSLNDVSEIFRSISVDNDKLINYINDSFMSNFINSKTIENVLYKYVNNIVSLFINSIEFKNYILYEMIPSLVNVLKTRSPILYSEIYDNIDNVKMYIKYLLIDHIIKTNNLQSSYRDILSNSPNVYNFDNFLLTNIVNNFYDSNLKTLVDTQSEYSKFITSISYLLFFDNYIDGFRLIKKYRNINPTEKIIESPYR